MKKVEIVGRGEEVVDRLVASGRCKNANQAVEISLRLLDKREEMLGALRQDIAVGMEEVYGGNTAPMDMGAIIRESEEKYAHNNPDA